VSVAEQTARRRCAVIYNPTKVSDEFKTIVNRGLDPTAWEQPMWLETTAEDPGRSMAAAAVEAAADLVIAAGGDGTVRIVADGLANSRIPMGVVPAGTGNLLAHSLDLPMNEPAAVDVAVQMHTRTIDLIKLTVDDERSEHFAVAAGTGMDAMIMDETNDNLKNVIGPGAYFLAVAKALGRLPIDMVITLDRRRPHRRRAMICVIANIGTLTGGIALLPRAKADDGRLDVYVASPNRFTHWVRMLIRLITFRRRSDDRVDEWQGTRVQVRLGHPDSYQLDGDVADGKCRTLTAEVVPGALVVCVTPEEGLASAAGADKRI
jgi:diacylglycerol kinase (ATP)